MPTETALKRELSERARDLAAPADAGEQLDMLPSVKRVDLIDPAAVKAFADGERKRGRPKGAEGVANRQLREMISRVAGNPLLAMARWAALEPEELAVRLGISKAEAFDRLIAILDKLAPYTAPRLAPVNEDGDPVVPFFMAVGGSVVNDEGSPIPPWERRRQRLLEAQAIEVEENQALSAGGDEKSNNEKSNGGE